MMGWQVLAKVVAFAGSAWMIRCMGPENLGLSALVVSTASAVSLLSNLGLDIVGTRRIAVDKHNARATIELIVGLRWRVSGILLVGWLAYCLVRLASGSANGLAWPLGAALMMTSGLNTQWILQGLEDLPTQSRIGALTSVLTASAYVLFFRPGVSAGADIAVQTLAAFVGLILAWRAIGKRTSARIFGTFDLRGAKDLLWSARWAFAVIITIFSYTTLSTILVARLGSLEQAGIFRAARTLALPITMLSGISGALLYPRLAVWNSISQSLLWRRQRQVGLAYAALSAAVLLLAIPLARPLVKLVLSEVYVASVGPFLILLAAGCTVLINGVFGWGIMAAGRERLYVLAGLCAGLVSIAACFVLIPAYGATGAAVSSLAAELIILAMTVYFSRRQSEPRRSACNKDGRFPIETSPATARHQQLLGLYAKGSEA